MCCRLQEKTGPVNLRGAYGEQLTGYSLFKSDKPHVFKHGGTIPHVEIAYETWGELNSDRSNAILLHTGLSASSHACSHKVSASSSCSVMTSAATRRTQVLVGGSGLLGLARL